MPNFWMPRAVWGERNQRTFQLAIATPVSWSPARRLDHSL